MNVWNIIYGAPWISSSYFSRSQCTSVCYLLLSVINIIALNAAKCSENMRSAFEICVHVCVHWALNDQDQKFIISMHHCTFIAILTVILPAVYSLQSIHSRLVREVKCITNRTSEYIHDHFQPIQGFICRLLVCKVLHGRWNGCTIVIIRKPLLQIDFDNLKLSCKFVWFRTYQVNQVSKIFWTKLIPWVYILSTAPTYTL